MCGEKGASLSPQRVTVGSPPHVRGKGTSGIALSEQYGITPACAGKSAKYKVTQFVL